MKRLFVPCLTLLIITVFFQSCAPRASYVSDTFISMDTVIEVKIDSSTADSRAIFDECRRIVEEYRLIFDANDELSELSRFNASENGAKVSEKLSRLAILSNSVSLSSDGAFDITTRPLTELWRVSEKENRLPSEADLSDALALVDYSAIKYDAMSAFLSKAEGQRIDLGGIAKGAAEESLIDYLIDKGVTYGVISFGGNIAVFGERPDLKPFKIALRDPANTAATVGNLALESGFVSVSGGYERYYEIDGERYHHIFDPKDGYPSDSVLLSVAVICEDGALADALSTALFVLGKDAALELYRSDAFEFEAIFVTDGEITLTNGLEGRFVITNPNYKIVN